MTADFQEYAKQQRKGPKVRGIGFIVKVQETIGRRLILFSLRRRRLQGDLIETLKISHVLYSSPPTDPLHAAVSKPVWAVIHTHQAMSTHSHSPADDDIASIHQLVPPLQQYSLNLSIDCFKACLTGCGRKRFRTIFNFHHSDPTSISVLFASDHIVVIDPPPRYL